MCGIVGYIGKDQAAPILLDGLTKLEYRGYDSAGVAVFDGEAIKMVKAKGKIDNLKSRCNNGESLKGTQGIGHTRWATHGEPSDLNAHPHMNAKETLSVVHNGIIENFLELKEKLQKRGYTFLSDTDTEVIVQLLDFYYKGDILSALVETLRRVEGSYSLGILDADDSEHIYAAKKDSPLIIGISESGNFVASDIPAILKYTDKVIILEDNEIVRLSRDSVEIFNMDLEPVDKEIMTIDWDISAAEKGGYEHFMMKEIHEQPKAIRDCISPRIKDSEIMLHELRLTEDEIKDLKKVNIIACGSAYHAGCVGKYVLEECARIPTEVFLASEFRYSDPVVDEGTLAIIISQSGETADTKAAMKEAKRLGARTFAIVNAVGSSIARESDDVMYTWAGPEIAVATTKGYTTQVCSLYLLAMYMGKIRGTLPDESYAEMLKELLLLPEKIESILSEKEHIQYIANRFSGLKDVFFIGRNIDYSAALEASLKLKEISYVHSDAYAAGELKHGTISLIEKGTLVISLATQEKLYGKIVSNMIEVRARGAFVMAVTNEDNKAIEESSDYALYIPKTHHSFTAVLSVIPCQLFAYYVAVEKGCDVDKPRNLAKSVTVE